MRVEVWRRERCELGSRHAERASALCFGVTLEVPSRSQPHAQLLTSLFLSLSLSLSLSTILRI